MNNYCAVHPCEERERAGNSYRGNYFSGADIEHTEQWQTVSGQLGYPVGTEVRNTMTSTLFTANYYNGTTASV